MPTLLITVQHTLTDNAGLRLFPGIRPSEMEDRPAIGKMMQGSLLELRLPGGTTRMTSLLTYGISVWKGEDDAFHLHDDPKNSEICLTLPSELSPKDVPPGTEVWLMDEATE